MTGPPLQGVRVLDLTLNLPGPYATFVLASLGADVIKLEPPRGDPARHFGGLFELLNRGKRGVVLDLREPASQPALQALVQWADVLVEGFRPGVMARLGCGSDTALAWNPRLVWCSISAFGQDGPRVADPAHDVNLQALGGLCHLERTPDGNPRALVLPVADFSSAMSAVTSICAALAGRGTDGPGVVLDVAMGDAVLSWVQVWSQGVDLAGQARASVGGGVAGKVADRLVVERLDRERLLSLPHYGLFRARDGQWLSIGIVDENHFWKALCEATGLGFLSAMPMAARAASGPVARRLLSAVIRRRERVIWLERFADAGVPATPVLDPDEALTEPQYVARGLVEGGFVRAPVAGAIHLRGAPPGLGEHTDAVLAELGVS